MAAISTSMARSMRAARPCGSSPSTETTRRKPSCSMSVGACRSSMRATRRERDHLALLADDVDLLEVRAVLALIVRGSAPGSCTAAGWAAGRTRWSARP